MTTINNSHLTSAKAFLFGIGLLMAFNSFAAPWSHKAELQRRIDALQAQIDNVSLPPAFEIGDQYAGGIVFYVDEFGQHGLISAKSDQSAGIPWNNTMNKVTGAVGDGLGAGEMSTAILISTQISDDPVGNFAAKVAADYSVQEDGATPCTGSIDEICYGDWYLPSKYELALLYLNKDLVGGFTDDFYWSSSEIDSGGAWAQYFANGSQFIVPKQDTIRVRAVRVF
ncbi:MAG: DUF1566 domain-containing protein [Nitrospinales bacterium]